MSIVDLAKARAYADWIDGDGDQTAAGWIQTLADEVESLQRALEQCRASQVSMSRTLDVAHDERDQAVAGLHELYSDLGELIADLPKGK